MSRSGYSDDLDDNWALIRWRGAVASAIRGQRGQAFLRELIAALDAMPGKRLIAEELINGGGEVCALGCVGLARAFDMSDLDPEDYTALSRTFGISKALVAEIEYENDEVLYAEDDPECAKLRWEHMRAWAMRNLAKEAQP